MRKLTTILAAAAAPLALGGVLLGTVGQASAAAAPASAVLTASVQQPAPSAYFWNPNGHALTGPQQMPGGTVSLASGYLAKVTADEHNANITGGKTITITGTLTTNAPLMDQPNGGDTSPSDPTARVYFEGGGAGTNSNSPDGYEGQQWWANASVIDLNSNANTGPGTFAITLPVDQGNWTDYNGQPASANPDLFNAAASHVRDLGVSFGGGWFFENGMTVSGTGQGSLTISSIKVS